VTDQVQELDLELDLVLDLKLDLMQVQLVVKSLQK
jgi:hypothetical protein